MRRSAAAARAGLVAALVGCTLAGCGKRGNPLPPLRPAPGPFTDIQARRVGDRVEIRFTVPPKNADNSVPPVIERVDVYAVAAEPPPAPVPGQAFTPPGVTPPPTSTTPPPATTPPPPPATPLTTPPATSPAQPPPAAGAPFARAGTSVAPNPFTPAKMQEPANLRGHVDLRRVREEPAATTREPAPPPAPVDPRPGPGDVATYVGSMTADRGAGAVSPTAVLTYMLVGVAGNRRTPSAPITIPLTPAPDAPTDVSFTYDEKTLTVAWTSRSPGAQFRIYDVDASGKEKDGRPIGAAPLPASPFTSPVEFGKPRCFAVHAVRMSGAVAVESEASAPVCQTPADTFPPAAPALHPPVPSPGAVNLIWDAVAAADLAGYVVLRTDGADETLHPLTPAPIAGTIYRDETTRAGVRYVYAIVAVDKSGNLSAQSNRVEVIGR